MRLLRRLAGGEWGAYQADGADGRTVVLKIILQHETDTLERVRRAVELTDRLRHDGYPIPPFLDVGELHDEVYTVQELVNGAVPELFTANHARQLLALWSRHEGAAAPGSCGWPEVVAAYLADAHELSGRVAGSATEPLAQRLRAIMERADPSILRTGDVEHGDFHHRNLLIDGPRVVAVFDWEGARPGDSRRDLLRLAGAAIGTGRADAESAALLRQAVDREMPIDVRALLGAMQAVADLRFGTVASPVPPQWILRSTAFLLEGVERPDH